MIKTKPTKPTEARKAGLSYFIRYVHEGHKFTERVGWLQEGASDTKHERMRDKCTAKLTLRREEIAAGTWQDPRQKAEPGAAEWRFSALVDYFLDAYQPTSGKLDYYRYRARCWKAFFQDQPARSIQPADVERFRDACAKDGLSPSTIRKTLVSLSTFFDWCIRNGRTTGIEHNPASGKLVRRPRVERRKPNPLSEEQERALMAHLPSWARPPVAWAIESGMDRCEVLALTWQHIDRGRRMVVVPRAKTGTERVLPLDGALGRLLADVELVTPVTRHSVLTGDGVPIAD